MKHMEKDIMKLLSDYENYLALSETISDERVDELIDTAYAKTLEGIRKLLKDEWKTTAKARIPRLIEENPTAKAFIAVLSFDGDFSLEFYALQDVIASEDDIPGDFPWNYTPVGEELLFLPKNCITAYTSPSQWFVCFFNRRNAAFKKGEHCFVLTFDEDTDPTWFAFPVRN